MKHSTRENQIFVDCCNNGKVRFALYKNFLLHFQDLCTGRGLQAKQYRTNVRSYNDALYMASLTANWQEKGLEVSCFNPIITLQGQIYHSIGAFVPPKGLCLTYLSVCIHDTNFSEHSSIRAQSCDQKLLQPVLTALVEMLQQHSSYVQNFSTLCE